MELQIQDLVASIKKEGIDAAHAEAEQILARAKEEAAAIVAQAKEEAERTAAKTQSETELMKQSVLINAEHARRDAMLSFKTQVQAELKRLLTAETGKVLRGETLAKLIAAALGEEDPAKYSAEVSEVTEGLNAALAEELRAGLTIAPTPGVRAGFRLTARDGSGYFDCSDEELSAMLAPFFPEMSL